MKPIGGSTMSRNSLGLAILLLTAGAARAQTRSFAANSIVIPMGTQWQTPAGMFAASGLVYRLQQRGITIYLAINPTKTSFAGIDFSITGYSGPPVAKYIWATGSTDTTGSIARNGSRLFSSVVAIGPWKRR